MLERKISSHNSLVAKLGGKGYINYINGFLVLGSREQFEYNTYQCKLVDKKLTENEACDVITAINRSLVFEQ